MIVSPSNVLIKITEDDRLKIFEKPITTKDGREFKLLTTVPAEDGLEDVFSQTVSVGIVQDKGENVKGFEKGDLVIMDYTVDASDEYVVERGDDFKTVSINAITTYEVGEDIIDPNRRTPHSTVVHKDGDLKEPSMVIAYVRDGIIHPNFPYVFVEYVAVKDEYEEGEMGLWVIEEEKPITQRKILFAHENSDVKEQDEILAEEDSIFNRELNGRMFGVMYEHDILAILLQSSINN